MAILSLGVDAKAYTPLKLPISWEAHIKVMVVSLEADNAVLPSSFCTDSILPLVATLTIFKAMQNSNSMVPKDKEQVTKAGNYLAKGLATIATLVDKSRPEVEALYDTICMVTEVSRESLERSSCLILPAALLTESYSPSWLSWMGKSTRASLCWWSLLWHKQLGLR